MRSRLSFDSAQEEANIDMTPMLDVVFIMLIFFIVSTTFVRDEGVEIDRPGAAAGQTQNGQALAISIDKTGLIWMLKESMQVGELKEKLLLELASKEYPSVLIKADKETATGMLINVLDIVKASGVAHVAVATQDSK
jgi:biopolymer transport protein ExbD